MLGVEHDDGVRRARGWLWLSCVVLVSGHSSSMNRRSPGSVSAGPGCVDEQGVNPLHPPAHVHAIDLDTVFTLQFLNITVGEPVAQVSADR